MSRTALPDAGLLLALLLALGLPALLPDWFEPVDHALQDWCARLAVAAGNDAPDSAAMPHRSRPNAESRVLIIDIDERSLAAQGAWPWPRDKLALLLRALIDQHGVSAVAIDMVFPERRANEDALALQLQREQVTGAVVFDLEQRGLAALDAAQFATQAPPPLLPDPGAPRLQGLPVVANHAALLPRHAGHITPLFDLDRTVRRLPPFLCAPPPGRPDNCLPTLALASFASLLPAPQLRLHAGRGLLAPAWVLDVESDGAAVASLPLAHDGTLVVPYRHRAADWISISATDILSGTADAALLEGSIALIGSTALGLSDVIATPFKPAAGGFEPHAEILSALLDDDFAYAPRWGWLLDAALLLPLALLLAGAALRYRLPGEQVVTFPLWLAMSWGVLAVAAVLGQSRFNLLLPLLPLLLFPPLALSFVMLSELYLAGRSRIGTLAILSAYLPRTVARRLALIGRASTSMDVARREITVLFADVRGFSGISESHSPEVVGSLMQRVFSEMAEAVALHHGTIDKFIGDAIMAFWNAPDDDARHAQHALAAAQDIQRRIQDLASYCATLQVRPLQVGIGIETGIALVGNFGTRHRTTYTALGDPVVLASRLEGLASGVDGAFIVIGAGCATALQPHALRALGRTEIRGRRNPIDIFTLPDPPAAFDDAKK